MLPWLFFCPTFLISIIKIDDIQQQDEPWYTRDSRPMWDTLYEEKRNDRTWNIQMPGESTRPSRTIHRLLQDSKWNLPSGWAIDVFRREVQESNLLYPGLNQCTRWLCFRRWFPRRIRGRVWESFKLVATGGMKYGIGSVFESERSGFVERSEETEGFTIWRKEECHFGQQRRWIN